MTHEDVVQQCPQCNGRGFVVIATNQLAREPTNQCDGCRQGLPLREGIHWRGDHPFIGCTADRYAAAGTAQAVREAAAEVVRLANELGDWRQHDGPDTSAWVFSSTVEYLAWEKAVERLAAVLAAKGVVPNQGGEDEPTDSSNSPSGHLRVQRDDGTK